MTEKARALIRARAQIRPRFAAQVAMRRERVPAMMLFTLALLGASGAAGMDLFLAGLPALVHELQTTPAAGQASLSAFMLGLAAGHLVLGPVSDQFGRWPILLAGTAVSVVTGIAAALAPTIELLIIARLAQGLAASAGVVLGRVLITDTYEGAQAARAFGILTLVGSFAPVAAPIAGGLLQESVGWRGSLWVVVLVFVVSLALVLFALPETLPPERRHRGGLRTAILTTRRLAQDADFVANALASVFTFASIMAFVTASPFILQDLYGLSPVQFSLAMACCTVSATVSGVIATRLIGRTSPSSIVRFGLVGQVIVTVVVLCLMSLGSLPLAPYIVLLAVNACLCVPALTNTSFLALDRAREHGGTASALMGTAQFALAAGLAPVAGIAGSSALPMTVLQAGCAVAALAAWLLRDRK